MKRIYKLIFSLFVGVTCLHFYAIPQQKNEKDYFALMVKAEKHLYGKGLKKDERAAFKLIKECAENSSNPNTRYWLGKLYIEGKGTEKSTKLGLKWLKAAADEENARAQMKLGVLYKEGLIVEQDFRKSYNYFLKAAKKDFPPAMYGAGYLKYKGLGTRQDYSSAIEWFKKGAQQKSAPCNFMLGTAYLHGNGVSQDFQKAQEYYDISAKQNHPLAKSKMSKLKERISKIEKEEKNKHHFYPIDYYPDKIDLEGNWEGKTYYLDYSKSKSTTTSKIKLELKVNNNSVLGKWFENNNYIMDFDGNLIGNQLVLDDSSFNLGDENEDTFTMQFLSCNFKTVNDLELHAEIKTYYPSVKEPGNSIYLILKRKKEDKNQEINEEKIALETSSSLPENNNVLQPKKEINKTTNKNLVISNKQEGKQLMEANSSFFIPDLKLKVYPNPLRSDVNVDFSLPESSNVVIYLYSVNGLLLKTYNLGKLKPGNHLKSIKIHNPKGSYLLVLNSNGLKYSKVLIKK